MRAAAGIWWRLVRLGFHLLYNQFAFTYDGVSWVVSIGAWRCWQRAALRHLPTQKNERAVLELAHGTGNFLLDLHAAGYEVVGCDLSFQMGRIARRKLIRHDAAVPLVRTDARCLPFAAGRFAAVVATFPTNFIFMPETIDEVYRVLEPGGRLIVVFSGTFTGGGVWQRLLELLYRITGQRGEGTFDVAAHFRKHGFEVQLHREACRHSQAHVLVASKGSEPPGPA